MRANKVPHTFLYAVCGALSLCRMLVDLDLAVTQAAKKLIWSNCLVFLARVSLVRYHVDHWESSDLRVLIPDLSKAWAGILRWINAVLCSAAYLCTFYSS
ncbi:hypothetical protein OPQ81_011111 [Rhizoctonia solani]|nr:hypothetical protein OPQ81_011111 [Rhizoctonia solani]